MVCSPEKLTANRQNSLKSTGPKTVEGKQISRRNGLKHGLTGAGIVIPGEDVEIVAGRFDRITAELKPKTELGVVLAEQVSVLSVRLMRCAESETATLSENVRLAESRSLETRLSLVDDLFDGLTNHPYTCSRQLKLFPEGIDRMLDLYASIRVDLMHPTIQLFDVYHYHRLDALDGRMPVDFPASRVKALSQAFFGNCLYLDDAEQFIDKLPQAEQQVWAKAELIAIIDARVAALVERRAELAPQEALARANLTRAARVDLSPNAQLARKYESAARRELFRSIRELREVEADAREHQESEVEPELTDVTPEESGSSETVASDFQASGSLSVEPLTPEVETRKMGSAPSKNHGLGLSGRPGVCPS